MRKETTIQIGRAFAVVMPGVQTHVFNWEVWLTTRSGETQVATGYAPRRYLAVEIAKEVAGWVDAGAKDGVRWT